VIVTKKAIKKQLSIFPHNFILNPQYSPIPAGPGVCYLKTITTNCNMNKIILTAGLALSLITSVHAQNLSALTVSGTMDYESEYVFRGKKVTTSAFQPSVNFSYPAYNGSINAFVWTSQPLGTNQPGTIGSAGQSPTNEIDAGIAYDHALSGWSDDTTLEIGYQVYWYPNNAGDATNGSGPPSRTHEFHIGATYDTTKLIGTNLSPSVFYYHDVILDSNTLQFGVAYSYDLSDALGVKGVSINPSANLGWTGIGRSAGDQIQGTGPQWKDSFWYWQVNAELDYKINTSTTFFAAAHYAGNSDGTTAGFGGGNPQSPGTANSFWAGLGVKFNM